MALHGKIICWKLALRYRLKIRGNKIYVSLLDINKWIQKACSSWEYSCTWCIQDLRSPNFFLGNGSRSKRESYWRWRGCTLGWMMPIGNTVLPVECLWCRRVAVVFEILQWRRLGSKNNAWLFDSSICETWKSSEFINNWVRHAMMALWTWKMCVRGYDRSKKAERRVKTNRRSLAHAQESGHNELLEKRLLRSYNHGISVVKKV